PARARGARLVGDGARRDARGRAGYGGDMSAEPVDLGDGHSLRFVQWSPDRALNPQCADRPDINPCGAIVDHDLPGGGTCSGVLYFDLPGMAELFPDRPRWTVESIEPLTL